MIREALGPIGGLIAISWIVAWKLRGGGLEAKEYRPSLVEIDERQRLDSARRRLGRW